MSPSNKLDLQEHVASPAKKQSYANQMFATIAPRYDLVTTLLSYGQDKRWKRRLVAMADVHPHHQVLDLACGTGRIGAWLREGDTALENVRRTVREMRAKGSADFPTLSVALQAVRQLAEG